MLLSRCCRWRPYHRRALHAVLERHCADVGCDPSEIARSANALLRFTEDAAAVEEARARGRPVSAGGAEQLREQVEQYAAAGAEELIIPDCNIPTPEERSATYHRFMREVAAEFR